MHHRYRAEQRLGRSARINSLRSHSGSWSLPTTSSVKLIRMIRKLFAFPYVNIADLQYNSTPFEGRHNKTLSFLVPMHLLYKSYYIHNTAYLFSNTYIVSQEIHGFS